jgi:hypothetical protein
MGLDQLQLSIDERRGIKEAEIDRARYHAQELNLRDGVLRREMRTEQPPRGARRSGRPIPAAAPHYAAA